jgi:Protein of unknown function (DUF3892)/PKD domain
VSRLTGDCDVVLEVRDGLLGEILEAMYAAGALQHHSVHTHANDRVELQVGTPSFALVTRARADHRPRARVTQRVQYNARPLADPADPGAGAVADISLRATVDILAPLSDTSGPGVAIGYGETDRGDIRVHSATGRPTSQVKDALLDFARDGGAAISFPGAGALGGIGGLGIRFLSAASGSGALLAVGMTIGRRVQVDVTELREDFAGEDWGMALAAQFVLKEVRSRMGEVLGGTPPPPGLASGADPELGVQIRYANKSQRGRVGAVGGENPEGEPWGLALPDAIALIDSGLCRFFTEEPTGDRVRVEAISRRGRRYLRTERDGDVPNNLLALPEKWDLPIHRHPYHPVTISDEVVCVLRAPGGACLEYARQRVILESLDVSLRNGAIAFTGRVTQKTDVVYRPDVSARFQVEAKLEISAGGRLVVAVGEPEVELEQWYARVFDFLSSNALEQLVRDGLRGALAANIERGDVAGFFSAEVLGDLAALGGTARVAVRPRPETVVVRAAGVVLKGSAAVSTPSRSPSATFAALPAGGPLRRIFHAGGSWSPLGPIEEYRWTTGDGHTEVTTGPDARFVIEHEYQAGGEYEVCLTVTDAMGQTASRCRRVRVPDPA